MLDTANFNRIIVYTKGRVDEGAHPAGTKLGKLFPEPPGIVFPVPVTAGTPVAAVRRNELSNELGTGEVPIAATSELLDIRNPHDVGF